jgi:hypothetical protein
MSVVKTGQATSVVSRGPSPSIWRDCPIVTFFNDPSKGLHLFDDFTNSVVPVVNETAATDFVAGVGNVLGDINWYAYVETDKLADLALQADEEGVLMLDSDGTDQDVNAITTGNNVCGVIKTPTIGVPKGIWFEARFKTNTITDGDLGIFVGLCAPGQAADSLGMFAGDAAALGDVDHIGFAVLEGDGDDLILTYNEATSGTAQSSTGLITLVADTYVRVGFKLEHVGQSIKIRWFLNGVDLGDAYAIDISTANANFPSATDMDVLISTVSAAATGADGDNIKVDWVRVAYEHQDG